MPTQYLSVQSYLALAKELTRGVAQAGTTYIPIEPKQSVQSKIIWLKDMGLRGSPVDNYNIQAGVGYFEYNFSGNVFADSICNLLVAGLGGPDTVTGGGPVYTHTIPLLNAASVGSQPPSYTIYDVDNIAEGTSIAKMMADGQLSTLDFTFNADGAVTYKGTWACELPVEVSSASVGSPVWTTENFIPAWNCSASLGPVGSTLSVVNIEEASLSVNRNTVPEWTIGQQSPHQLFAGPIDVTGKLKFVAESGESNFSRGLSTSQQIFYLTFTEPVSGHNVIFQMNQVQFENPVVLREKSFEEVSVDFAISANTTNAASGFSPLKVIANNGVSGAY